MIRVSLLTTLVIYKTYFKKVIKHGNRDLELIYSVRSYYVYAPWGFVTKCFLIFIVYEVKKFAANNNQSSC